MFADQLCHTILLLAFLSTFMGITGLEFWILVLDAREHFLYFNYLISKKVILYYDHKQKYQT